MSTVHSSRAPRCAVPHARQRRRSAQLVPAVALLGGAAMYLLAHVALRLRNMRSLSGRRLVCAIVLLALLPAGVALPALATLAVLAAVLVALIAYEALRYAEVRDRVRHQLADGGVPT